MSPVFFRFEAGVTVKKTKKNPVTEIGNESRKKKGKESHEKLSGGTDEIHVKNCSQIIVRLSLLLPSRSTKTGSLSTVVRFPNVLRRLTDGICFDELRTVPSLEKDAARVR